MKFSEMLSGIAPSATLDITSKAKALKSSGEDVVILAAGEPDFDTPDIVKNAAIKAIKDGKTKYTPACGTKSLREAICAKFKTDNDLDYNPDQIVVSNGAKHSIYNALVAICNPGDEVIVLSPYWLSYPEMVRLAGAQPVIIKLSAKNGFRASAEEINRHITRKTKAVIINSPSNPAGVVYDRKELEAIADVCLSKNVMIISDEIYEKIIFDGKKHFSIAAVSDEIKARTILINGVSKSFSMTGWRIGYMAASKEIIGLVSNLQSQSTSNPCSISQEATQCALMSDLKDELERNNAEFKKRRDVLVERISGETSIVPFKPAGAFYLFCDISSTGMSSAVFAEKFLEEKKVAVIPGGPFGHDDHIRISFAIDLGTINKGLDRLRDWLRKK